MSKSNHNAPPLDPTIPSVPPSFLHPTALKLEKQEPSTRSLNASFPPPERPCATESECGALAHREDTPFQPGPCETKQNKACVMSTTTALSIPQEHALKETHRERNCSSKHKDSKEGELRSQVAASHVFEREEGGLLVPFEAVLERFANLLPLRLGHGLHSR